jgi:hypothetical protein
MSIGEAQLASAMLSIHAAEMEQAERCPDWRLSSRLERRVTLNGGGNRALCWLGCLFERLGHRLQEYAMPQLDSWVAKARNKAEVSPRSLVQLG